MRQRCTTSPKARRIHVHLFLHAAQATRYYHKLMCAIAQSHVACAAFPKCRKGRRHRHEVMRAIADLSQVASATLPMHCKFWRDAPSLCARSLILIRRKWLVGRVSCVARAGVTVMRVCAQLSVLVMSSCAQSPSRTVLAQHFRSVGSACVTVRAHVYDRRCVSGC